MIQPREDLTGHKLFHMTVLKRIGGQHALYECQCDCGKIKTVQRGHLLRGRSQSCGCMKGLLSGAAHRTHGMSKTLQYKNFRSMIARCEDPKSPNYKYYGGRGISVSPEWRGSFETFLADMGPRPVGMSLDRIDVNGPYSKENCRWASFKEQARNKRNNFVVEFRGESRCLTDWSEQTGVSPEIMSLRLRAGWSPEQAITTPVSRKNTRIGYKNPDSVLHQAHDEIRRDINIRGQMS